MTALPRDEFAVTQSYAYLNHAAVGVLPRRSRGAIDAFIAGHAEAGVLGVYRTEARMPEFRERIGRFIGASGGEIAILRNTSDGANVLAGGIQWEPGDEVLLPNNEFPANAIPWLRLREAGVEVRLLDSRERLTPDRLRREITARTRLVSVSWVGYHDGYRYDLAGLAHVAHEAGAYFAVDAIQGLGAFPIDVRALGIDALYAGGAKWMLSLQGVSLLYVASALRDRMRVAAPGWRSMADMWDFLNYEQPLVGDGSRFEGGTPNFVGALSLERAVDLFEEVGTPAIAAHVLTLTDRLVDGLRRVGAEILSERGEGTSSGIVTFRLPGSDSVALGKALQHEGIVTTWRPTGIRVAPHGYNTADEIDHLVASVPACAHSLT